MDVFLLLAVSIGPGLAWVWYFSRKDPDREPAVMLLKTFAAGALAVAPAALLEAPLRPYLTNPSAYAASTLVALLLIGLIEEGVKFAAVYRVAYVSPHFNEPTDGIIYAMTAALGFAAAENLFYTINFGPQVALVRAVVTSLAHASFAGVYGVAIGLRRTAHAGKGSVAAGFITAVGLHSLYDYIVVTQVIPPIFAVVLIYYVYRYVGRQLRLAAERS